MRKLFEALKQALKAGQNTVLVTLTESSGSVPRSAGARMLVSENGIIAGTVGGGAAEYNCLLKAQKLLGTKETMQISFELKTGGERDIGMICGGDMKLHLLPIPGESEEAKKLSDDVLAHFKSGEPFWLLTPLKKYGLPILLSASKENETKEIPKEITDALTGNTEILKACGESWFCEKLLKPGKVYVFGGGHVAQALVPVLAELNFVCVVLEDREAFAKKELFPKAFDVKLIDFSKISDEIKIENSDFVCIMTHGHIGDLLIQRQILKTPAKYIGVIGSARKAESCFKRLRDEGFPEEEIQRIVSPIGIPLGGGTPAEIAISIAAQLIQCRSKAPEKYWLRGNSFQGGRDE